ncbi:hypothetical protein H6503_03015 [Candidatus Woesearchaeota archaeon]|nr:hypothetical protein [Candidatus Woesearchaeota archaeon]
MLELQQFGLTKTESHVYVNLLRLGSTTSGPLVKKTELHRATVYDVLKRLMEKGLVDFILKGKTKYFQATDPSRFLEFIEEEKNAIEIKERNVKNVIGELKQMQESSINNQIAHISQGLRAIKAIYDEITKADEAWIFGSSGRIYEILGNDFVKIKNIWIRKKVRIHHLVSERSRGGFHTFNSKYAKSRYLPKTFESPISTLIWGSKVGIFLWIENPVAFVIESKEAADAYKTYFDLLWKTAKK